MVEASLKKKEKIIKYVQNLIKILFYLGNMFIDVWLEKKIVKILKYGISTQLMNDVQGIIYW